MASIPLLVCRRCSIPPPRLSEQPVYCTPHDAMASQVANAPPSISEPALKQASAPCGMLAGVWQSAARCFSRAVSATVVRGAGPAL